MWFDAHDAAMLVVLIAGPSLGAERMLAPPSE
jgi:hypothetical protein